MSEERTAAKWKIVAGIAAIVLTVGAGVGIFVGVSRATCKHVWNAGEITAEATCFTAGEITYTCEECGKKNKEETQPLQHVTDYYLPPIAATCEEQGREPGNICPLCDTILVGGQKIPALGHHIVEDPAIAPTCLGTGKTKGSHCDRDGCDYIGIPQAIVPATGHSIVTVPGTAATCTTNGWTDEQSCEWCGYVGTASELLPALGHKDEDWDGECDVCEIDICAEGMHVAEVIPAVQRTCTTDGWTEGMRCANCEEILVEPEYLPAYGHDLEAYIDECSYCGELFMDGKPAIFEEVEEMDYIYPGWYAFRRGGSGAYLLIHGSYGLLLYEEGQTDTSQLDDRAYWLDISAEREEAFYVSELDCVFIKITEEDVAYWQLDENHYVGEVSEVYKVVFEE